MQRRTPSRRWMTIALAAGLVAAAALAARGRLANWTHATVAAQHLAHVQALPEGSAAQHVRQLVRLDADAPAVLVPLLADQRPTVAAAASEALPRLVADWQRLPAAQSSPRIARLASELASHAPRLPPQQRRAAHELAARLLVWPLDEEAADAAQVLADCEAVLRLPLAAEDVVRVAAATPSPPLPVPAPVLPEVASTPAPPPAAAVPHAVQPQIVDEPRIYGKPIEPERLIDASRERPEEPRQLRRPRAVKIEG